MEINESIQVGTRVWFANQSGTIHTILKPGKRYFVQLDYDQSLITCHSSELKKVYA